MPLALGNSKSNTEALDLLTPNRLKMGRNNERSPEGCVTVEHPDKILEENQKIFDCWFEIWLSSHVPKLVYQPKWFKSDENLKPGDVVLFLKDNASFASRYQYGIIHEVEPGRDNKVRKVIVQYRNHKEMMTSHDKKIRSKTHVITDIINQINKFNPVTSDIGFIDSIG